MLVTRALISDWNTSALTRARNGWRTTPSIISFHLVLNTGHAASLQMSHDMIVVAPLIITYLAEVHKHVMLIGLEFDIQTLIIDLLAVTNELHPRYGIPKNGVICTVVVQA
jgi:hypothetical protein